MEFAGAAQKRPERDLVKGDSEKQRLCRQLREAVTERSSSTSSFVSKA
jgi:hypothetical protein